MNTIALVCPEMHQCAVNLYQSYTDDNADESLVMMFLCEFMNYIQPPFDNINISNELVNIFIRIGKLFNIKSNVYGKETSYKDIFDMLITQDAHNLINEHNETYSCKFHNESLLAHLHMAAIYGALYSINADGDVFIVTLTGLLHDIGKMSTVNMFKYNNDNCIGYPFHGEMGCGIIHSMYNEKYENIISKLELENVARAVSLHMCGCHTTDFDNNQYTQMQWNIYTLENRNALKLLECLSVGDVFACINEENKYYDALLVTRSLFFNHTAYHDFVNPSDKIIIIIRGMDKDDNFIVMNQIQSVLENNDINHVCLDKIDNLTYLDDFDVVLLTPENELIIPNDRNVFIYSIFVNNVQKNTNKKSVLDWMNVNVNKLKSLIPLTQKYNKNIDHTQASLVSIVTFNNEHIFGMEIVNNIVENMINV